MAFTEGFISELVGRKATVNEIPIGRVSDFLVNKPDDVFPRIDGLVIKTSQGLRFAPIDTVATIDPDGKTVALTMTGRVTSRKICLKALVSCGLIANSPNHCMCSSGE